MPPLAERLRLIVITDRTLAAPRSVLDVVRDALAAGAPAIQLREKELPPREVLALAQRIREQTEARNALFFVNDRLDLALAVGADGVHLGPEDLPVAAARAIAPPGFLIGYSTDDPASARAAVASGADYLGCGTVYVTATKANAGDVIGTHGLAAVVRSVDVPVVGIGGITPANASAVRATGAAGCAVVGAIMGADDISEATSRLLE